MSELGGVAVRDGLNIILELASDPEPVSGEVLQDRCELDRDRLGNALDYLSAAGLVAARGDENGVYCLASPATETPLRHIQEGLGGRAGSDIDDVMGPLAAFSGDTTLAEVTSAIGRADQDVCPYIEACMILGCPEEGTFRAACKNCK